MKTLIALLLGLFASSTLAFAEVDARMFRFPDVSESRITFVYAGDIWVVEKQGGTARRLSSPPGEETFPRFSPDGSEIAFSGNYDGNTDETSSPRPAVSHAGSRITLSPTACSTGPRMGHGCSSPHVAKVAHSDSTVATAGGLPVPYGEFGALSTDGGSLAFTPKSRGFRNWKRYRGGMAPEIWLFDLESLDARNLTNSDANDAQPMWHGSTLYFLSDRGLGERSNIWALDVASNDTDNDMRQITRFADFDVTFPAIGPAIWFSRQAADSTVCRSRPPISRPPASAPSYRREERSSPSRPKKVCFATSPTALERPSAIQPGLRMASSLPTGVTRAGSTSSPCAAPMARVTSRNSPPSAPAIVTASSGRRTATSWSSSIIRRASRSTIVRRNKSRRSTRRSLCCTPASPGSRWPGRATVDGSPMHVGSRRALRRSFFSTQTRDGATR